VSHFAVLANDESLSNERRDGTRMRAWICTLSVGHGATIGPAFVVIATAVLCASATNAYTRMLGPAPNTSIAWTSPKLRLRLTGELPGGLSRESAIQALERAARSWSAPLIGCTSVEIGVFQGESAQPNGANVVDVSFRHRYWCRDGIERLGSCYDHCLAALTTLELSKGATAPASPDADQPATPILGAMIEVNDVDNAWTADEAERTQRPVADLDRTIVHELGHVLDFAHNCLGDHSILLCPD